MATTTEFKKLRLTTFAGPAELEETETTCECLQISAGELGSFTKAYEQFTRSEVVAIVRHLRAEFNICLEEIED